jgi:polysaccharide deacetylase family protein (PEP-CTERM system associated)
MLTLTVDIEQYASSGSEGRFLQSLQPLLNILTSLEAQVTFFIVGDLVHKSVPLVRELHENGHEIALHGYSHQFLKDLGPTKFRSELIKGKELIEDIVQEPTIGFRAPYFSLTKEVLWAPEILGSEGFVYSSSVLPSFNPQSGYPEAPREPFRWPNGLIEFPSPTLGLGKFRLPILGGAYLRLSPKLLVKVAQRISTKKQGAWSYCHPYDFDIDEEFKVREENGWLFSKLLFARRHLMLNLIKDIVTTGSLSLGQIANTASVTNQFSIWDPLQKS